MADGQHQILVSRGRSPERRFVLSWRIDQVLAAMKLEVEDLEVLRYLFSKGGRVPLGELARLGDPTVKKASIQQYHRVWRLAKMGLIRNRPKYHGDNCFVIQPMQAATLGRVWLESKKGRYSWATSGFPAGRAAVGSQGPSKRQ